MFHNFILLIILDIWLTIEVSEEECEENVE